MMDKQEQKRAAEWSARIDKIQKAMSRMADTVGKKNEEIQRKEDMRFLQHALERDRKEEEKEIIKKKETLGKENEVKEALEK